MSKVVLVTGGSGYFGNLLVRQLCDDGYFVRIFGKSQLVLIFRILIFANYIFKN